MDSVSHQIFNVHLKSQQKSFDAPEADSVLESGLRHGLAMRYECSNGTCGTCTAKLLKGKIKKVKHQDFVLSDQQKQQNAFLTCCNAAASDVEIDIDLISDVSSIALQKIKTKVKKLTFLNDNFAVLTLKTPRSQTLQFMAGQSVELSFKGSHMNYPLASCPCHGMALDFHIRNLPEDSFSQAVFNKELKPKSTVNLEGPKGIFTLKETSKRPMLFIAWDSGFAPIGSLIEHAFSLEKSNPVYFYWAYPANEKKPYFDNHARSWFAVMDNYTYTPIACVFDRNSKNDCQKVSKKIFNALDLGVVKKSDVYVSAPAEVLIYLGGLLLENGLDESQLIASPI